MSYVKLKIKKTNSLSETQEVKMSSDACVPVYDKLNDRFTYISVHDVSVGDIIGKCEQFEVISIN